MDEATRQSILARIRRDAANIGESDRDLIERAMTIILKMASDPVSGPLTFLMPDDDAIRRIDFEDDAPVPPELRDQCIGLLLDQMVIGKLPAAGDEQEMTQFSTLGGATGTVAFDQQGLVLTDTTGRRVRVSEPIVDGSKLTMRQSDDLLMWDEWGWDKRSR